MGELTWRLGLILGATNLLFMGISLSAANPRRASNWGLLFAALAFVIYYNLLNLTQAWVGSGQGQHRRRARRAARRGVPARRWA